MLLAPRRHVEGPLQAAVPQRTAAFAGGRRRGRSGTGI